MPVLHDLICANEKCEHTLLNHLSTNVGMKCPKCKRGRMETYYGNWGRSARNAAALGIDEMTVVYENAATGEVNYPGRNDTPMPARLSARGFVRREMRSLREVEQFSQKHGLINERAHYDTGSGRNYEDEVGRGRH